MALICGNMLSIMTTYNSKVLHQKFFLTTKYRILKYYIQSISQICFIRLFTVTTNHVLNNINSVPEKQNGV